MRPPTLRRGTLAALTTGLALLLTAGPAAAHVGVNPESAQRGGYARLAFRVPDEQPTASTVKVEVVLPAGQPLAQVSVRPLPGWTVSVEKHTLPTPLRTDDGEVATAVTKITWAGGKVRPSEFQEFVISAGPLPDHGDRMVFKVLQTYDNGEVARWIEAPAPDGSEPEHPAPVLALTPAGEAAPPASAPSSRPAQPEATVTAHREDAADGPIAEDGSARLLAGIGVVTALLALLTGLGAWARAARAGRGSRP